MDSSYESSLCAVAIDPNWLLLHMKKIKKLTIDRFYIIFIFTLFLSDIVITYSYYSNYSVYIRLMDFLLVILRSK